MRLLQPEAPSRVKRLLRFPRFAWTLRLQLLHRVQHVRLRGFSLSQLTWLRWYDLTFERGHFTDDIVIESTHGEETVIDQLMLALLDEVDTAISLETVTCIFELVLHLLFIFDERFSLFTKLCDERLFFAEFSFLIDHRSFSFLGGDCRLSFNRGLRGFFDLRRGSLAAGILLGRLAFR